MNRGDIYDNQGEQLQILSATAFEVKYRKRHWRPKKSEKGKHIGGSEPYYHTYVIGADRAYNHVKQGYWVPVSVAPVAISSTTLPAEQHAMV